MGIKNLLLAYNGTESSDAALASALFMQEKYDAHLTGLLPHTAVNLHQVASAWIPESVQEVVQQAQDKAVEDIHAKFMETVKQSSKSLEKVHWISKQGHVDATVAKYSRFYDLTIIGRYDAVLGEEQPELHPDMISMVSGRPVMLVPRQYDMETFNEHAVLAWDGKRASARALADAMQILETKSLVSVLTVEDGSAESNIPQMDIETALQRHGIRTEVIKLKRNGKSIGNRILEFLDKTQPRLLVMGAYEHSKFRQSIVGGVTSTVLKKAKIPIIISH